MADGVITPECLLSSRASARSFTLALSEIPQNGPMRTCLAGVFYRWVNKLREVKPFVQGHTALGSMRNRRLQGLQT